MQTSGRGRSEKAMIVIPAGVLLWAIVVVTGGPTQFIRVLNSQLRDMSGTIGSWVSLWF